MAERAKLAATRSTLLIPFIVACAVIADRAQLGVSTGGRGALPLLAFVAPVGALSAVAVYGRERSLRFLAHPIFIVGVLPYIGLTAMLPVLGVMFYGYPERTLIAITGATTALSFLAIGAALSTRDDRSWAPWLLGAIVLQFVYSLGQAIYLGRGPGWELFTPFHAWDLSQQGLSGTLIQARSIGLYFNPNELGLWAGMAAILAWGILPSRLRFLAITLAVLTLLLSQSRGATVALVAALIAGIVFAFAQGRVSFASGTKTLGLVVLVALVAGAAALLFGIPTAALQRFGSLFAVLTQGPQADPNLAGRIDYWAAVTALNSIYPLGTWGPPELLLGTAVDSSWFQAFAQGSVPYAAALGLLLISAMSVGAFKYRHALRVLSVLIAVAGLTQTPFGYPPILLFWVLLGAGLQASATARAPVRRSSRWQVDSEATATARGRLA